MKKVYLPVYIIEWSDVRPYVYATGRGIRAASLWTWAKICLYTPIIFHFLKKWTIILLKLLWRLVGLLCKGVFKMLSAIWGFLIGMFAVSNPRGKDDDEYEDDEDDDTDSDASTTPSTSGTSEPQQRTIFDYDD